MSAAKPVLFGDRVDADIQELREIAAWFDLRGDKLNGDFLRDTATRYEVVYGAYCTKMRNDTHLVQPS